MDSSFMTLPRCHGERERDSARESARAREKDAKTISISVKLFYFNGYGLYN